MGRKDTTGHVSKDIEINSSCVLDYEIDEYNLNPINGAPEICQSPPVTQKEEARIPFFIIMKSAVIII